jgi:hypothetical protein
MHAWLLLMCVLVVMHQHTAVMHAYMYKKNKEICMLITYMHVYIYMWRPATINNKVCLSISCLYMSCDDV